MSETQKKLIVLLSTNGDLTRKQLCKLMDLPRTTVYDNLKILKDKNIVSKYAKNNGERGRPQIFWKLN